MYLKKPTQEELILNLLKQRKEKGAFVWEFMMPKNRGGLGIAQYNARIWALRKKGFDIRNLQPGHFYLFEKIVKKEIPVHKDQLNLL